MFSSGSDLFSSECASEDNMSDATYKLLIYLHGGILYFPRTTMCTLTTEDKVEDICVLLYIIYLSICFLVY
jgi:hypothetical protein